MGAVLKIHFHMKKLICGFQFDFFCLKELSVNLENQFYGIIKSVV